MKFDSDTVRRQIRSQSGHRFPSRRLARLLLAGAVLAAPSVASAQSACDADLDGSGEVNGADLTVVLVNWGACKGSATDTEIVVTAPPLEPGVFDVVVSKQDGSGADTAGDAYSHSGTTTAYHAALPDYSDGSDLEEVK